MNKTDEIKFLKRKDNNKFNKTEKIKKISKIPTRILNRNFTANEQ